MGSRKHWSSVIKVIGIIQSLPSESLYSATPLAFQHIDQGLQTDVFILDFAKAFGSVPHELLKGKRFRCGINGKTVALINKFLYQTHQRVAVIGSK